MQLLPLKHCNGKFIHPDKYAHYYSTGIPESDIDTLISEGYNNAIAVMHGAACPDLMCLDFDEKNAPGVNLYETWRHLVDDYIFQKLVIERTRSGGYHVYFQCTTLPPVKALASSPTGEEWIAIRSSASNGITYCAPSPGYTEIQGSLLDVQYLEKPDMFALCSAAAELDRYTGFRAAKGTMLPSLRIPHRVSAIVEAFDRGAPENMVPDYLFSMGWSSDGNVKVKLVKGERWEYLRMWRPGRDTRDTYSANYWITRRRLSVFTQSTPFPAFDSGSNFSHSPSSVIFYSCNAEWGAALNKIIELSKHYNISLPSEIPMAYSVVRGRNIVWNVEVEGIIEWAKRSGYQWMRMSNEEAGAVQLIRVVDNVIYDSDEKDLVRSYLEEANRNYPDAEAKRCLQRFAPQVMRYMDGLPLFDQPVITDERNAAYIYFNNGALKITSTDAKLISYAELGGCVFSKYIKAFDYSPAAGYGVFGKFVEKVTMDESHRKLLMSVMGYVMHHHKLRNNAKAVMLIEDVEDQEEARGRSGKGLLAQFVEWIRWSVQQDGRNFKADSQFKMQRITPGVQVYYLNDPSPGVLMNQFYNFITDDWTVEAKGKKSYIIKFRDSPKILITTNYLPNLESDSDRDRFIVLPIKKHFGASLTVRDEFPNVIFFGDEWDRHDRDGAVLFAVDCIKQYLQTGVIDYKNEQFEANAAKRTIRNQIPDSVAEVLEQALEAAKGAKSAIEFEMAIKVHDLRKDAPETLVKAFYWRPGYLGILVSPLYHYCLRAHHIKMLDKIFGKKVRTYIKLSGWNVADEKRNNSTGRRIEVCYNEHISINTDLKISNEDIEDDLPF
jgi:hypothetical protein